MPSEGIGHIQNPNMETRKTQLYPNKYYHIYNRGINGQNIFLEEKNYAISCKNMHNIFLHTLIPTHIAC